MPLSATAHVFSESSPINYGQTNLFFTYYVNWLRTYFEMGRRITIQKCDTFTVVAAILRAKSRFTDRESSDTGWGDWLHGYAALQLPGQSCCAAHSEIYILPKCV